MVMLIVILNGLVLACLLTSVYLTLQWDSTPGYMQVILTGLIFITMIPIMVIFTTSPSDWGLV